MTSSGTGSSAEPKRRVSVFVKLFVLFHLVAITVWALPHPRDDLLQGKRPPFGTERILLWNHDTLWQFQPIELYLFVTGFWQYWDMFAPDPAQIDFWCDAKVVYKDGAEKTYQYPRIYSLPIPMKFIKERFRKFYERVNSDDYSNLWSTFGQRIAHEMDDPKNPPVEVKLVRHWLQIVPPGKPQPTEYNHYEFYDYAVDQKRLEWARTHF